MKTKIWKTCAAIATGIVLSSCGAAALHPMALTSKPPVKAVSVTQEFTVGDGFLMKKFIFPKGIYQPMHEDAKAFYYAPPGEQIKVYDSLMNYGSQGGIYWEKGLENPEKIYFTGNFDIKLPWVKKDMPVTLVH